MKTYKRKVQEVSQIDMVLQMIVISQLSKKMNLENRNRLIILDVILSNNKAHFRILSTKQMETECHNNTNSQLLTRNLKRNEKF